jgi:heavy metal translocating P-type ATPase
MAGACAHCELPLGRRAVVDVVDGVRERFCCYGCALALQITRSRGEAGAAATILVRLGVAVFFAINVMMVSVPTYVPYVYGASAVPADGSLFVVLRVLALVLAMPVLLLLGVPVLVSAWHGLRDGDLNADSLIILGTFAAYGVSVANTVAGRPEVYFDTAAMLLVLVTLGRYLEASAKAEAGAAVRAALPPGPAAAARVVDGTIVRVAAETLVPGDVVVVGVGEAFPTDGAVLAGTGGVDEAALTGEAHPVLKAPGAAVASGSASLDAVFRVRVGARAADSTAARIAALLGAAKAAQAPMQRAADRAAAVLAPLVVVVACLAAAFWTVHDGGGRGVLVGLSVLVVACPCAFGLATPVAIWTGLATAARRGVVVRSAPVIERAARVREVLFDKTGTLTTAVPRVVAVEPIAGSGWTRATLLARTAALESHVTHPFARAVVAAWAATAGAVTPAASDVRLLPGRGVRGCIDGTVVTVGSWELARETIGCGGCGVPPAVAPDEPHTSLFVMERDRLVGIVRVAETMRPRAAEALAGLRRLGIRVGLLSGDTAGAAVVPGLIPAGDATLGLLPHEKVQRVRRRRVAMVGDGVNDAPALAAADVGIAVGTVADLTRMTADVAVLGDDLEAIPWLLAYARRVRRVIHQNLLWAVGYNAGAVALAAMGRLNPLIAAVVMLGSSLAVVANARRLRPTPRAP